MLLAIVSCNLWLFPFPTEVSGFGVVAFQHLLDALDRAVQLPDQILIGSGEQIGKKLANLRTNLGIFLATGPYFKQILPIYRIPDGDAHSNEQSTETLQQPMRSIAQIATRKSTSKLTNQAIAPQSTAAARTLGLPATSLALLSQSFSRSRLR